MSTVRPLRVDHGARCASAPHRAGDHSTPVHRLSALDAPEHLAGVTRGRVRRRAGQVLADARRDLSESRSVEWRGDAESRCRIQASRGAASVEPTAVRQLRGYEADAGKGAGAPANRVAAKHSGNAKLHHWQQDYRG